MSSLDSTINSLSAATIRTCTSPSYKRAGSAKNNSYSPGSSRYSGAGSSSFSRFCGRYFQFGHRICQQGWLVGDGPILAMFLLGILTRFGNELGAILGLITGLAAMRFFGSLHRKSLGFGGMCSALSWHSPSAWLSKWWWYNKNLGGLVWYKGVDKEFEYEVHWPTRYRIMGMYSVGMIIFCTALTFWLRMSKSVP